MKTSRTKRTFFILLLFLAALGAPVLAAPLTDAVVPTATPLPTATLIPTITLTPIPPTALPGPSATPTVAPTQAQVTLDLTLTQAALTGNNIPETTDNNAAAAGSSILGFLLCAGVILVAGLAALNIWASRRP
jgi:hypothetical protein